MMLKFLRKDKLVTVRLNRILYAKLIKAKEEYDLSTSDIIRIALIKYLGENK